MEPGENEAPATLEALVELPRAPAFDGRTESAQTLSSRHDDLRSQGKDADLVREEARERTDRRENPRVERRGTIALVIAAPAAIGCILSALCIRRGGGRATSTAAESPRVKLIQETQ